MSRTLILNPKSHILKNLCIYNFPVNKFWSLVFFFFLLLVPNDLQSLLAPNPHSKRIKFNNELLYTMFDRVYNDMNPVQFKEYYKTSRETLYVLNEKKESQISIASNILAVNSSGQSKNIQKYKNPLKMYRQVI